VLLTNPAKKFRLACDFEPRVKHFQKKNIIERLRRESVGVAGTLAWRADEKETEGDAEKTGRRGWEGKDEDRSRAGSRKERGPS